MGKVKEQKYFLGDTVKVCSVPFCPQGLRGHIVHVEHVLRHYECLHRVFPFIKSTETVMESIYIVSNPKKNKKDNWKGWLDENCIIGKSRIILTEKIWNN